MIKNISQYTVVLLFFITIALHAQTPAVISKPEKPATSYTVTAATGSVTLIASETITFGPGTFIQAGSTFTARISSVAQDIAIPVNPSISKNDNYIYTRVFQSPMATVKGIKSNRDVQESITYFDGLGRLVQNNAIRQGGDASDIITHIEYDGFGRQGKEYLPFSLPNTGNTYSRVSSQDALNKVLSFYNIDKYGKTLNPFSEKRFEPSPLNRVLEQAAPGNDWAMSNLKKNTIKSEYQTNISSDAVKLYKVTTSWQAAKGLYDIAFSSAGTYGEYELYKNVTYDENSGVNPSESSGSTIEFKNKEGQIVLKRTYNAGLKHDTYYVYDIYGNLTYVIPPKADSTINQTVLDGLCYQYKYDNKKRLVEKRLPGKQWEFIVYDKLGRPVATGPALSPFTADKTAGWLITKYDVFGRPIYTGWNSQSVNTVTRNTLQTAQNSATILFETKKATTIDGIATNYNNSIAPTSFKLLTVNYYDDYTFPAAQAMPVKIIGQKTLTNTKGLATGNWTRTLTTTSAITGETATIFYDSKGRVISNYIKNYLGGISHTDSEIDFTGKTLSNMTEHQQVSGGAKITVKEKFTYTAQNRLLTHTHQIGTEKEQLLADNTYDALGQLVGKNVGNITGSPLQKIGYNYNIRGWLTEINKTANLQQGSDPKDLFAFKINYNTTEGNSAVTKALYNGNIAETFWTSNSDGGILHGYGYQYDLLNRLKNATYQTPKLTDNKNYFGENMDYDKNGNIMKLQRKFMAGTISNPYEDNMDNLGYFYPNNSNQLMKVTDTTNNPQGFKDDSNGYNDTEDDYAYDDNGNLTKDQNKSITEIIYNHLNLPKKITFVTTGNIEYIYNASGQKLEKIVTEKGVVTNTKYLNGFQYKNNVLQFFPTTEGYVKNTSTNPATNVFQYVFNYTDHLGNVRVSYTKNPTTSKVEILEENNYYPFGFKHQGYNIDNLQDNYLVKYNSKEFQKELDLNVYDYGARNYDPAIGRWMNIDPKGELLEMSSPYVYAFNCPVIYLDKDGELPIFINGKTSSDSERGSQSYWTAEIIATVVGSGIANPGGQIHYVDGDRWYSSYTHKIENSSWKTGGVNFPDLRKKAGYEAMTKSEFKSILSKLERNSQGKIIEKIQIYTHSRGAAFGVGYTEHLLELIKQNANEFADANNEVDFVFNIAPHQSNDISAPEGVDSYSIDRTKDPLSGNDIKGIRGAFKTDEGGYKKAHSITTFGKDLKAFTSSFLKGGTSASIISNFVKTMKDKYNINVTVQE
ncbi:RHS repeat-associated protein [Flavobacterium sp. 9]|uniref:DUF6443 domain-containing protein n=1 Tax=Flavobacterium sp. 9 TaxID=2035198 RepID=UPI000C18492F|nr:DUF6443 domain-containing protein [Flavobacterium sp. 9]PIF32655.1 RHS repeat-associated protein [Flavobacterium sp. 9]